MGASRDIHIIGAGLAGCLLSLYLAKLNYKIHIYERRADMRKQKLSGGRSINLALAERGLYCLRKLGLEEPLRPLMIPMKGRMLHSVDGALNFQPYSQFEHEMIYSISRSALNERLLTEAENHPLIQIYFHQRCVGYDFSSRQILLRDDFNDADRQVQANVVIGADGSASAIRSSLAAKKKTKVSIEPLAHGYKEHCILPRGHDFAMEKNALHIWPRGGFMLIALPNADKSFTLTLFYPEKQFVSLNSGSAVVDFFHREFPDAVPLIDRLTESFLENPQGHLETVRCESYYESGNVLLLGDAAHAIVPFHGQGANCAFEDCEALARILENSNGNLEEAFQKFEEERRPNAEAIADMALENYIEMRDSVRDPEFQAKKELEWALEKRFPDQFIPRYSMVMFRRISYALAKSRGQIQAEILNTILREGEDRIEELVASLPKISDG